MNTSRRRSARSARALARLLLVLLCAGPVTAAADAVPSTVAAQMPQARLAGEGELRWLGLRVYTAQLWTGPAGVRLDRLGSSPLALELRYLTSLKSDTIASSSLQEMERLGMGDAQRRSRWVAEMRRVFPNVARGDRLVGVIEPGRGTRFFHNDKPLGQIEDPEFSSAFFSIWLDERTVAPSLRESLLKRSPALAGNDR